MSEELGIVVVGASAGGVPALKKLVAQLPADFPAAVFVVLHIPEYEPSSLADILGRASPLPAAAALDGETIRPGRIYVAVPGHHLLVERDRVGVKRGPKENRLRPAIDALFRSAAYNYRQRVIGIVLSGILSDGISGLWTIKQFGGKTIVQEPGEAEFDMMPLTALQEVDVDHTVAVGEMGSLLSELLTQAAAVEADPAEHIVERVSKELDVAASAYAFERGMLEIGERTAFTCPECHGALAGITEGRHVRYRCHTGHAFTGNALLAGITDTLEESLWNAVRALEEAVLLLDQMGRQSADLGRLEDAGRFRQQAETMRLKARTMQEQAVRSEHLSRDNLSAFPAQPSIAASA